MERLLTATNGPPPAWLALVTAAKSAGVDLCVNSWDTGISVSGNGLGAAVGGVELDVLTGEYQLLKADGFTTAESHCRRRLTSARSRERL